MSDQLKQWKKTAVLGGDARMLSAARHLAVDGHAVAVWGLEGNADAYGNAVRVRDPLDAIRDAELVLLPIPTTTDGVRVNTRQGPPTDPPHDLRLAALIEAMTPDQRLFGGRIPPAVKTEAEGRGIAVCDYADEEIYAIRNALPTAEGALVLAMRALPVTLAGCRVGVLGYGRIGRVLCRMLHVLEARVTVAARKPADLARIVVDGATPLAIASTEGHSTLSALRDCRVIFNTVPHRILDADTVPHLRRDVCIIDLASAPGGIDPQLALDRGLHLIRAPGLPGKCAPETAGEIIAETVIACMRREGVRAV